MDSRNTRSQRVPDTGLMTGILFAVALLTFAAAIITYPVYFPFTFSGIQSEWGIATAYSAVEGFVSQEWFGTYFLIARYLVAAILIATAAVFLFFSRRDSLGLGVAAVLSASGPALGLAGETWNSPLPAPFGLIFDFFNLFFLIVFLLGVIALGHLYPDRKFPLPWMKRVASWSIGFLVLGILLLFSGAADAIGELAWTTLMVLMLLNLAPAALSLLRRLRERPPGAARKGVFSLAVLFSWITTSITLSGVIDTIPTLKLAALHLDLFALGFLALSIFADLWGNQLWGPDIRPYRRLISGAFASFILLVAVSGWLAGGQIRSARAASAGQAANLLARDFGPLIVDTDMGNDDILALLFLMEHPGVDLQALTVVGTGLAHCDPGVRNALGLLELSQSPPVPVSCGSETPFGAEHEFPEAWRAATDRLWGFGLPTGGRQPDPRLAPDLIGEILHSATEPVTILALGPLTNFAQAFGNDPALVGKIGMLYIMGGAVEVPGNVYDESLGLDNKTAEWNVYADTVAARMVFESGVPITLVPLDATNYVPVDFGLYREFEARHGDRVSTFVFNIFYINQGWIASGFYYLWDTLAAAAMTAPELVAYQTYNLAVITESGPNFGRTAETEAGRPVRVATWADVLLFKALFVETLAEP